MTILREVDRLFEVEVSESRAREVSAPAGRDKTFRPYDQHQSFLLPPSLDDWQPAGHCARFISETVDCALDLTVIYDSYANATGAPPFDPAMMTKLLLYGYSVGVTSSREMERRCCTDVAFRWLAANAGPDYRSIACFRRRHLGALEDLFTQVLVLCQRSGLVKLGRVALDGTKVRASAVQTSRAVSWRTSASTPSLKPSTTRDQAFAASEKDLAFAFLRHTGLSL